MIAFNKSELMMSSDHTLYSISEVARLTGVNPVTLRAWQRRYGLVVPQRTAKGHRLYGEQDVALIRQILSWLALGVSIGQVPQLLQQPAGEVALFDASSGSHWEGWITRLDEALIALSQRKLESLLGELLASYPLALIRSQVLTPWVARWSTLRERADGEALLGFVSAWAETFFARRLIEQNKGRPLVLAGWGNLPPLALALDALAAMQAGYQVLCLPRLSPPQARLLAPRWQGPLLVLTGAGLSAAERGGDWPAGTVLLGELAALYDDSSFAPAVSGCPSLESWLAGQEADDATGLV